MTDNPFLNAGAAALYVSAIALFFYHAPQILGSEDKSVLIPILLLSLFVISALVMGFSFLYRPLIRYFEGDKRGGLKLLLESVLVFGLLPITVFLALLLMR